MTSIGFFQLELSKHCSKCGRNPQDVTLVAVSKKQPLAKIHQAFREKHFDFGENYVQEALEKQQALDLKEIRWHMIGPIQTNKINKMLGRFFLIHSVDSLATAIEINKRAQRENLKTSVLLQVNLAGEKTKSGMSQEDLLRDWQAFQDLHFLELRGLMTMPPLGQDPESSRPFFRQLKKLADHLNLKELSMGTSSDWRVAVEEGATFIRLGTSIFGERTA
jgi:pyridoxal phosphate enzyme (YggS family)